MPSGGVTILPGDEDDPSIRYSLLGLRAASDAGVLERLAAIDLRPTPQPDASGVLRLAVPDLPSDLAIDPDRPLIEQPNRRNALVVKGTYLVPRNLSVIVETDRGPVGVTDREGSVGVRTGGGEVRLDRVVGRADIDTRNGVVLVDNHRGSLDVDVWRGDIFVWIRDLDDAGMHLQTKFGNIQAEVPPELEFELEIRATRGEVENGFGLPLQEAGPKTVGVRGRIGEGGRTVRAITAHGNAAVRANEKLR